MQARYRWLYLLAVVALALTWRLPGPALAASYSQRSLTWRQTSIKSGIQGLVVSGEAIFAGTIAGIFRSLDDGATWEHVAMLQVKRMTATHEAVYAWSHDDILKVSRDGGDSWSAIPAPRGVQFLAADRDVLFLLGGTHEDIKLTLISGNRSSDISDAFPLRKYGVNVTSSVAVIGRDLFVGTQMSGLYRSRDQGRSWEQVIKGRVDALVTRGSALYLVNQVTAKESKDGGSTWRDIPFTAPHPSYIAVGPDIVVVASFKGAVQARVRGTTLDLNADRSLPGESMIGTGLAVSADGRVVLAGMANLVGLYRLELR